MIGEDSRTCVDMVALIDVSYHVEHPAGVCFELSATPDLSISRDDTVGWKRKYHNSNSSSNTSTGSKSHSIIDMSVHPFNEQEPWVPNSIPHLTHPSDWQLLLGQ